MYISIPIRFSHNNKYINYKEIVVRNSANYVDELASVPGSKLWKRYTHITSQHQRGSKTLDYIVLVQFCNRTT